MSDDLKVEDIKKLGVSPPWIEGIFRELTVMDVSLEPDPLSYGPKYLAAKIAKCRNFLSRTEQLFNEISYRLSVAKRLKIRAEADWSVKESHLLTNDPTVRAQRSVSDRKAQVVMALTTEMAFRNEVETVLQDLENTLIVIKSKRADLKDIQGRIRDQIKLCQELVALGSHWGSRLPPGRKAPDLSNAHGYVADPGELDSIVDTDDRSELTEDPDLAVLLEEEMAKSVSTGTIEKMRAEIEAAGEQVDPVVASQEKPSQDGDLDEFLDGLGVTEPIQNDPPTVAHVGDTIFEGKVETSIAEVATKLSATVSEKDVDSFFTAMDDNLEPENTVQTQEIDFDDLLGDL